MKQKKNVWIPVEDYRPNQRHEVILDYGRKNNEYRIVEIMKTGFTSRELKTALKRVGVKRVMILSRK